MGIDSMRVGGGRCPPLLVGGLLIACLMLICNWWTSSSENLELLRQIDDFSEQLKISAEERDQCVTLRGNLEQRYKHSEDEVASLHVRLEQQIKLKKRNEELEEANTICKSELDSLNKLDATKTATLDTLRLEKDSVNSQLDEKKEENQKLLEKLMKVQDELNILKSAHNLAADQEGPEAKPVRTAVVISKPQLGPVAESAVRISSSGQHGLKYHNVPILPRDLPGAVRQAPRFSVTMLKAETGTQSNIVPPIIPTEQDQDTAHGIDEDNRMEDSIIGDENENTEDNENLGNLNNEAAKEKSEKLNRLEK